MAVRTCRPSLESSLSFGLTPSPLPGSARRQRGGHAASQHALCGRVGRPAAPLLCALPALLRQVSSTPQFHQLKLEIESLLILAWAGSSNNPTQAAPPESVFPTQAVCPTPVSKGLYHPQWLSIQPPGSQGLIVATGVERTEGLHRASHSRSLKSSMSFRFLCPPRVNWCDLTASANTVF